MGSFRVTREARSTPILWQLSSRKVSKSRRWIELEESGGEGGIRTPGRGFGPYNGLANRRLQPLGHLSGELFV